MSNGDVIQATQFNNLRIDVRATHDHEGTEGQQLDAANSVDAGLLTHERGGVEADISAITTDGILYGTASGAVGILAGGSALYHLRVNAGATALEWAAVAGSAVITFEGSDTSEATTTSSTPTDLIDVTSISVPAVNPFQVFVSGRKGTGNAVETHLGLKLNTTVVGEADATPVASATPVAIWTSEAASAVNSGLGFAHIGPRVTSHLRGAAGFMTSDDGGTDNRGVFTSPAHTADMPTATITSVIIRGDSDGTNTLGADELYVMQVATS